MAIGLERRPNERTKTFTSSQHKSNCLLWEDSERQDYAIKRSAEIKQPIPGKNVN